MSRTMQALQNAWKAETSRHFLWLPAGFAAGIALYFALPVEPPPYLLPILLALSLALCIGFWRRAKLPLLALLLVAAGAAWMQFATLRQPQMVLREALEPRPVTGIVEDIQRTEHGVRLTLRNTEIKNYPPELTPSRVRISLRLKKDSPLELPHLGDRVNLMAGLRPPMGPALPHGFDFARYFYFHDIGAVGFGLPPWRVVDGTSPHTLSERFWDWRVRLTESIITKLGKETGAIAAGLVTGDAKAIRDEDFEALRASNLYHIIAISGEHMVVIAGVIFISLRLLALLLPRRIAFRPQIKTAAAIVTLLLVTAYLFVTGLPVSAVRAYFMIFLVLMAVILRRQVDPMRSLAITALIMLLWNPANLLDPGFQLSFAATLAIVALVESTLLRPHDALEDRRWQRILRLILTMLMISVVAEAATAPLVIAMFNNLSIYGVFANMLATPLVSLFLMPTVALYFILLPFGVQGAALWLMQWGIKGLLAIAHWVSALPHAQWFVPSLPGYGVALFVFGLLWLCIWQTGWRRYGFIAMALGLATLWIPTRPDALIGGELKQIVLKTESGYALARGRKNSMIPELWANGLGYKELPKAGAPEWRCDTLGCVATVEQMQIAFPRNAAALAQDKHANVIFTTLDGANCEGCHVYDADDLQGSNVMALWIDGKEPRIERSSDWQGNRPWTALAAEEKDED